MHYIEPVRQFIALVYIVWKIKSKFFCGNRLFVFNALHLLVFAVLVLFTDKMKDKDI